MKKLIIIDFIIKLIKLSNVFINYGGNFSINNDKKNILIY